MVSPMRMWAPLAALLFTATAANAQPSLAIKFDDGLVTMRALNVPVRSILTEWARVGGVTLVNAERVAGAPVTLELIRVPEREALRILLRGLAGYALGARPVGAVGASAFNRIVLLPTSVSPAAVGLVSSSPPASADGARPRPTVPAFVARPGVGPEGNPPQGSQPRGQGVFGPDFRERPPESPTVPPPPEEIPDNGDDPAAQSPTPALAAPPGPR